MDSSQLTLIRASMERQLARIEQIYATLFHRVEGIEPGMVAHVESAAYQLHNLYGAMEDLMQIVAKMFENNVSDLSRWHTQLLDRMTLEIEGIRPALFSEATAVLLHRLRGFRHFFRHAYAVELDYEQVRHNLKAAEALRPLLRRDVQTFLQRLEG